MKHFAETPVLFYVIANPVDNWCILGLERSLLIVGVRQMAAPSLYGYSAESAISTQLILLNGTSVPMVIVCKHVCFCQP
jgi:hypothetical protein